MNKKAHIIFAFLLSFLFILFIGWLGLDVFNFSLKSIVILCVIVLFYSLLPDIDHKTGTITWFFLTIGILGVVIGTTYVYFNLQRALLVLIFSTSLLVITLISANFLKHRGIVHTIWTGLLAVLPLWFLFYNFSYCLIGYVAWYSHLLGDGYILKIR